MSYEILGKCKLTLEMSNSKFMKASHVLFGIFIIKSCRTRAAPLSIYKDSNANGETCPPRQPDLSHSWCNLGARAERNKENNAIPAKWKSYKVLIFHLIHFTYLPNFVSHIAKYLNFLMLSGSTAPRD